MSPKDSSKLEINNTYIITVISVLVLVIALKHFAFLLFSILITLCLLLIITFIKIPLKKEKQSIRTRFPRLYFTKTEEWVHQVELLESSSKVRINLNESEYSDNVNQLIDLIIRDFVSSWFSSISQDKTFPNEVKSELNLIILNLEKRLKELNTPKLIVLKVLPIITKHFQNYLKAKDIVLDDLKKNNATASSIGLSELNFKIVKEYEDIDGINHLIELRADDMDLGISNYSRDRFTKILPYLIPNDELNSESVETLVKELLSQVVFLPLLRLLSDPNFWNGIIIKFATIILKDRDQVRELKKVIDKQTSKSMNYKSESNILQNKISTKGRRINPQMKPQEFQKYLKNIESIDNVNQLKQLRYFIALQINRTQNLNSTSDRFLKYCQRLDIAKETIESRILQVSAETHPIDAQKRNSLIFNKNNDLEDFILNLSLFQVLTNPSALPFFKEFLKQREKADLLNFWIAVDQIKDPLEDSRIEEEISFEDNLNSKIGPKEINEIKKIFNDFFASNQLNIDSNLFNQVDCYCSSDGKDVEEYYKIRKLIIFLQIKIFKIMETDFKDFKNSDFFLKLLSNETFEESLVSGVDNLEDYNETDEDIESDSELQGSELQEEDDQSLMEIENALNTILTKPDMTDYTSLSSNKSVPKSTSKLKNELFGEDNDDSFLDEKPLFKEENKIEDKTVENELLSEETLEIQNDFIKPTHDEYNLKEEISNLNTEITKLNKQSSILDPLILKAELMNNSQELRLLRKSKASYQREIDNKESIKQQLIVQDNENSLFGKTKVTINSWVKAKDEQNGSVYILYLIEIEKDKSKSANGDKLSWVVGRRFSQFWRLNEHLKKVVNSSNDIPFPRKKIVLKFQEKSIIDERRVQLENYLNELLQNPQVCQDKEFRKFLTVEDYRSAVVDLQNSTSSLPSTSSIKDTANKLYNGIYSGIDLLSSRSLSGDKRDSLQLSQSLDFNEDQDNQSDSSPLMTQNPAFSSEISNKNIIPTINQSNSSFIKPIIELFTALFPLSNQTNNWLRGQAIVLILQQIFGSTIEKHLKTMIVQATCAEKMNELVSTAKEILWPNNIFMSNNKDKEKDERELMKEKIKNFQDSKKLLNNLINDIFGKVVGVKSCESTSGKIHGMLQLNVLNLELLVQIFDVILLEIYDELHGKFD